MGIQERLLKARYSEYNLHMPSRESLFADIIGVSRHNKEKLCDGVVSPFINVFYNPPRKDKHYKSYSKVVSDYKKLSTATHHAYMTFYSIKLLAFFIRNSDRYYSNYELFSIPYVSHNLFTMRKYVMSRKMQSGELPILFDIVAPSSHGYYNLPKPMASRATIAMGQRIFDILEPRAMQYLSIINKEGYTVPNHTR